MKLLQRFPHTLTLHTNSSILSMAWWAWRRGDIPINPSSSWGDSSLCLESSELWREKTEKTFCRKMNREGWCCFPYKAMIWGLRKQRSRLSLYCTEEGIQNNQQKIIAFLVIQEQLTHLNHFAHVFTRLGRKRHSSVNYTSLKPRYGVWGLQPTHF